MKTWIKLYTEALHDRKMRKMSRFDKSVFYDLLLLSGQEDNGGMLPNIEDIALELDLKLSEAQKSINTLIKVGVITKDTNDNLMVTNFQKRQDTNLSNYEKVKRYRDNQKKVINDNPDDNPNDNPNDNQMITEQGYQKVINDNPDDTKMITVEEELRIKNKEIDINSLSNERELKRPKTEKTEKQKYGSMQNVLLYPEEYAKLCERFDDADAKIENLSLGIASKGYKYKDHYATILTWARKDAEREKAQPKPQAVNKYPDIYTMLKAEGMQQ